MINEALLTQIKQLSIRCMADKVILFGSRARDDYHARSDVDLAIYGMPPVQQAAFTFAIEELDTLLEFDLVYITEVTNQQLIENIKKDGVVLMDKLENKLNNLTSAVERLREAVGEYVATNSQVVRDGVIQRFEFSTELAWKSAREYLLDQGYTEINSPKAVLKAAFSCGLIDDESGWLNLLNDRNNTSHIYDEESAALVYTHIVTSYIALFDRLIQKLKQ